MCPTWAHLGLYLKKKIAQIQDSKERSRLRSRLNKSFIASKMASARTPPHFTQATLVGLVDNRDQYDQVLPHPRAISPLLIRSPAPAMRPPGGPARRRGPDSCMYVCAQLMDACRALAGKAEQPLLHKESVYKQSPHLNPGVRMSYKLLVCSAPRRERAPTHRGGVEVAGREHRPRASACTLARTKLHPGPQLQTGAAMTVEY